VVEGRHVLIHDLWLASEPEGCGTYGLPAASR
jgi:hypothetical protein